MMHLEAALSHLGNLTTIFALPSITNVCQLSLRRPIRSSILLYAPTPVTLPKPKGWGFTAFSDKCDNRACCNPKHLFLGTHQDNMDDMKSKNRQANGEKIGNHKLTRAKVDYIRSRFEMGGITKRELAQEMNVTDVLIGKIVRKEIWKFCL